MKTILIVDDSAMMRSLIKSMVSQQDFTVVGEAENGKAGVEKYKELRPDAVTMDVIMEEMNGLMALEEIIAYDPNAVVVMFSSIIKQQWYAKESKARGAKAVLIKPFAIQQLNETLHHYTTAGQAQEAPPAAGSKPDAQALPIETDAQILETFRREAEKAAAALREALGSGDFKRLATTAHAMKSALALIGERAEAERALTIEQAGHDGDSAFLAAHVEPFVAALEALASRLRPTAGDGEAGVPVTEDAALLAEQLLLIKVACENYDDSQAYAALDLLKKRPLQSGTATALEQIREMLFLHSDFEGAATRTGKLLDQYPQERGT